MNKHNLSRNLPSSIAYEVRQRCGFGCVVCGESLIDYHHFAPEFKDAIEHKADGITLLCCSCHRKAGHRIISLEKIIEANKHPFCRKEGFVRDKIFANGALLPVQIGSTLVNAASIILYENMTLLGFSQPINEGEPITFSAFFTDPTGKPLLVIINNEWTVGVGNYDVSTRKDLLRISSINNSVDLEMLLSVGKKIIIRKLNMFFLGFHIIADNNKFSIKTPRGSMFNHHGENNAEIGIWLKQDGRALIAANRDGGAVIQI